VRGQSKAATAFWSEVHSAFRAATSGGR